ncbi:hypothetical protein ATX61_01120 [Oenococcus oeni]|nr:hypothetical protein [Oenococcus oeni]OIM27506.1 hypothetical protein ATX61_01120 [Oenococcus oeni]
MKNKGLLLKVSTGLAAVSFLFSEYLFKISFKRVDHVPETSQEKQNMRQVIGNTLTGSEE